MTRGSHTEAERANRIGLIRSQMKILESARIVVVLEGMRPVTDAAYEVCRSCSEWFKEVRNVDSGLLGIEHAENILRICQREAEQCLEEAHAACRLDMSW